jgi:hypothetical protein
VYLCEVKTEIMPIERIQIGIHQVEVVEFGYGDIGMSVPPVMTAQIAHQIWIQWLIKINKA